MTMPDEPFSRGGASSQYRMDNMEPGPMGRSYMGQSQAHLGQQFVSPGLDMTQERVNSLVPSQVKVTGSPNGMSANQAQATMNGFMKPQNAVASRQYQFTQGGMLPNAEGTAADTYMGKRFFGNGGA